VHDIGVHEMLVPDAALNAALDSLPGRKVIHTNGTREHAVRVLEALGIAHHFSTIYDIRFNAYQPKPCASTLGALIKKEGMQAARTLVIDDMQDNLTAARAIGAQTALISLTESDADWDYQSRTFAGLCRIFKLAGDGPKVGLLN